MKKFKLTIIVSTEDDITKDDFRLLYHDVIDGFELTRDGEELTEEFKLKEAYIDSVLEMETDERKLKIQEIRRIIEEWGATSSCELELEASPCLNSMGNGKRNVSELIESFNHDGVGTVVYQDELELDENDYTYEELSDEIIDEISDIMEQYDVSMTKTMNRCKN